MTPRQAIDTIPGFDGARLVAPLVDGVTNSSHIIERKGEKYLLRIDKPAARELGLDRVNEKHVSALIAQHGLGPPAQHFEPARGLYVRRFLEGRSWTRDDLHDRERLERLARLLSKLHGLPARAARFDPLGAARHYAEQLGTEQAAGILRQAEQAWAALPPAQSALCHNDLVCENIFEGESLQLIDWEFAAVGDPYFDLAVVVQHHGLADELAMYFLSAYLARPAGRPECQRLVAHRCFYRHLLELWSLRTRK